MPTKNYNIRANAYQKRTNLYNLIQWLISEGYTFIKDKDYVWFKENIVELHKHNRVINDLRFTKELESFELLQLPIIYINTNTENLCIYTLELHKPKPINIPEFKKGEDW